MPKNKKYIHELSIRKNDPKLITDHFSLHSLLPSDTVYKYREKLIDGLPL